MTEVWRPVVGYESCYEVSDYGNVRSLDRTTVGRQYRGQLLRPQLSNYYRVALSKDGIVQTWMVHVLVLEAFSGPRPDGFVACHNDGDVANNRRENLRWDTASSNNDDIVRHGRHHNALKTHCKYGHAFTADNTRLTAGGSRWCRECGRVANRKSYAKRVAA